MSEEKSESRLPLDRASMRELLERTGRAIAKEGKIVEIAIFGGSALVLQFDFRDCTEDVDYIPVRGDNGLLKRKSREVARQAGVHEDWLSDAMWLNPRAPGGKGLVFFADLPPDNPGLRVMLASPEYLFAMKTLAMRSSAVTKDVEDIWNLWDALGLETAEQALEVCRNFYPGKQLPIRHIRILQDIEASKKEGLSYSPMLGW